jgi:two-component system chemotaxis response regulator CheY
MAMAKNSWFGQNVVIIDDSGVVREELRVKFEACGFKVVAVAVNGLHGLELVKQHRPDLVSIDIIMPEMDGIECYKKIRAFDPNIKCVIISWLAGDAKIIDKLSTVVPKYILQAKPLSQSDLESRIQRIYHPDARPEATQDSEKSHPDDIDNDDIFGDLGVTTVP